MMKPSSAGIDPGHQGWQHGRNWNDSPFMSRGRDRYKYANMVPSREKITDRIHQGQGTLTSYSSRQELRNLRSENKVRRYPT